MVQISAMLRSFKYACCLCLVALVTACHGECYTSRYVLATGRFGDTLVAVSTTGADPGSVRFEMQEQMRASAYRYAEFSANPPTSLDTVSLYRMTLVSDPTRAPVLSSSISPTVNPGTGSIFKIFTPDTVAFGKLFVHLATEDVLFELVGKNGAVVKALLNLEDRQGPRETCDPWT